MAPAAAALHHGSDACSYKNITVLQDCTRRAQHMDLGFPEDGLSTRFRMEVSKQDQDQMNEELEEI
jgi:hypothetical protein